MRALRTPVGVHLSGHVNGTPHLRANPSSTAIVLQDLQNGEPVDVTGCSEGCDWYLVAPPNQPSGGWVPSAFVEVQGDDHKLPAQR